MILKNISSTRYEQHSVSSTYCEYLPNDVPQTKNYQSHYYSFKNQILEKQQSNR